MSFQNIQKQFTLASTWHGNLNDANALLQRHPELSKSSIHIAAILGDNETIKKFLSDNPSLIMQKETAYDANPLTMLCFSRYLSCKKIAEEKFLESAQTLIDAGADVNAGFYWHGQFPDYESPLYGAAGLAHNAKLTKLLLQHGADPNDGEAVYHSPETYDNDAMKAIVQTNRVKEEYLSLMLIRKHDFHDYEGVKWLLNYGVDPNWNWGTNYPLHHALKRNNHIEILKLLFDHGADPFITQESLTSVARAAREGRKDVLELLDTKNFDTELLGVDKLIAACARGNSENVQTNVEAQPKLKDDLLAMGDTILAKFCGNGNVDGTMILLQLGIDVNTPYTTGDGYFETPAGSLPLHVAAWRAKHDVVKLLIQNGAAINSPDANGRSPLALAVKACVNSYWMERRSPESVRLLLEAGADANAVSYPTGYDEVDKLLVSYRR